MKTSSSSRYIMYLFLFFLSLTSFFTPVSADTFTQIASMNTARYGHTATLLPNGTVLVVGGALTNHGQQISATAEIYNPATGTWTPTGSLNLARYFHSAVLLDDGRVLVAGGWKQLYTVATNTAEIYNPATGTFSYTTNNMTITRSNEASIYKRDDGNVVIIGGSYEGSYGTSTDKIDIFNVSTESFSPLGTLNMPRKRNTMCPLSDTEILIVGGGYDCCSTAKNLLREYSAEIVDPYTGTSTSLAASTNYLQAASSDAELLPDGRCLSAGYGIDVYNPVTQTFTGYGDLLPISDIEATVLNNGKVLMSGNKLTTFDVTTNLVHDTGFTFGSAASTATKLLNGDILIAGGIPPGGNIQNAAYVYSIGPQPNAGLDQTIDEGTLGVTLDGSGSTGAINYTWTQVAGPIVTLSDSAIESPTFNAPYLNSNQTLTFQLVVDDGAGNVSSADLVNIIVVDVNTSPTADAGIDSTGKEGSLITLDGSGSFDPNGDVISYQWAQTYGTNVTLSDPTVVNPSFIAPTGVGGVLVFELIVSDAQTSSVADAVSITVVENSVPVANAGPNQTINEGTLVTLSGSGSDPDGGDTVSYLWSGNVTFSDATSPTPSFTAPYVNDGGETLTLTLTVTDNDSYNPKSSTDGVNITVLNINDPPSCSTSQAKCVSSKVNSNGQCVLWPPNHSLVEVNIEGLTDPNNNDFTVKITGVTQDEPTSGGSGGDTSPDAVIQVDPLVDSVLIRAEQNGPNKNGRVYVVSFDASDSIETCSGTVTVSVPKKKSDPSFDDGQTYDSTLP